MWRKRICTLGFNNLNHFDYYTCHCQLTKLTVHIFLKDESERFCKSDNLGRLTLGAMLLAAESARAGAPPIPDVRSVIIPRVPARVLTTCSNACVNHVFQRVC